MVVRCIAHQTNMPTPSEEVGVLNRETGCAVSRSPKGGEEEIAWAL
jgi:hypothetical protein